MLDAVRRFLGLRPPFWDARLAARLPGKYVIVGLTYLDTAGGEDRLIQLHGVIASADPTHGIAIDLRGARKGETYWLPPQTSTLQRARRGTYRLRETGDVIQDPDYVTTWRVEPPRDD